MQRKHTKQSRPPASDSKGDFKSESKAITVVTIPESKPKMVTAGSTPIGKLLTHIVKEIKANQGMATAKERIEAVAILEKELKQNLSSDTNLYEKFSKLASNMKKFGPKGKEASHFLFKFRQFLVECESYFNCRMESENSIIVYPGYSKERVYQPEEFDFTFDADTNSDRELTLDLRFARWNWVNWKKMLGKKFQLSPRITCIKFNFEDCQTYEVTENVKNLISTLPESVRTVWIDQQLINLYSPQFFFDILGALPKTIRALGFKGFDFHTFQHRTESIILEIINALPTLLNLNSIVMKGSLKDCPLITPVEMLAFSKYPTLRKIKLTGKVHFSVNKIAIIDKDIVRDFFSKLYAKNLTIDLNGFKLSNIYSDISRALSGFPQVKEVSFTNGFINDYLSLMALKSSDSEAKPSVALMSNTEKMNFVSSNLGYCNEEMVRKLISAIPVSVKYVSFQASHFGTLITKAMHPQLILSDLTVETVSLAGNMLYECKEEKIAEFFSGLSDKVKTLDLCRVGLRYFSEKSLIQIFSKLPKSLDTIHVLEDWGRFEIPVFARALSTLGKQIVTGDEELYLELKKIQNAQKNARVAFGMAIERKQQANGKASPLYTFFGEGRNTTMVNQILKYVPVRKLTFNW